MKKLAVLILAISLSIQLKADNDNDKTKIASPVISGQVIDNTTGEKLAGATIKINGTEISVFTDFEGVFRIPDLKPGKYTLEVSLISYKSNELKEIKLDPGDQKALKVELKR